MARILIPTDFSEHSEYAYESALKIYGSQAIEIFALSVVTVPPEILFDENGEFLKGEDVDFSGLSAQKKKVEDQMKEWLEGKKFIKEAKVKIGRITNDILLSIANNNIDLLVMGTSGAFGMKDYLVGSHTSYVAMRSPVPVLSVKRNYFEKPIQKLAIAGDFRNPQMVSLEIIKQMQKQQGIELHLVKVNTPGDFETNTSVVGRMKEFSELNELNEVHCHVYNDHSVEKGISTFSHDMGIDLIAIGSYQRTGMSRIVKKSISYDAINHIDKAIISFPIK